MTAELHADTLDTFARFFPLNPFKHGRVLGRDPQTGKKKVQTLEGQAVQIQHLKSNLGVGGKLAGNALGYLPGGEEATPVGAIDLDGKDFPGEGLEAAKRAVLETCAGLNLNAYAERSSSGKGWHIWLFASDPLPYKVMRDALRSIARRADVPSVETYPMGTDGKGRWIITPYYAALKKDPPYLGRTYLEGEDGQPIPVDELHDWIEQNPVQALQELAEEEEARARPASAEGSKVTPPVESEFLPEAVDVLLAAARAHAPDTRHDALAAFLNLAQRAGNLAGMVEGLKEPEVFDLWCADSSRTAQEWAEEIDRWAENVEDGDPENRRGLPYLKEAGFSIPDLPKPKQGSEYPEIVVNTQRLRDIAEESVIALLARNDPPRLFSRAGELGRLIQQDNETRFKSFDQVALKGELERSADFVKEVMGKDNESYMVAVRPPNDLAPDLLARVDQLPFPILRTLATTPLYSAAGDLIAAEGYHSDSGVFLTLGGLKLPSLPTVEGALELLRELLHDFPFAHRAGFAHTVGALLVPFLRPMIDGPTPLHLIEAPTRGTGKGLLSEVIPAVALGTDAGVMVQPKDGDEFEKRVTSMLLEGSRVILLDNVHALQGEALAAALTARTWRGRRLGKSEMLTLPNDALWMATGNNVSLDDDMPRRIIPIRLDAGVERPEDRTGFRHPNLLRWIREHRAQLVGACLALVEAWKADGRPAGATRLGSYESWSATVGGVLQVAGIEGFLEAREHLYEISNPEPEEWGNVLDAVYTAHGGEPVPARAFLSAMMTTGSHIDLWEGRKPLSQLQKIGRALLAHRDRVFSGRRLRVAGVDSTTKNKLYRVELVTSPGVSGVAQNETPEKHRANNDDQDSIPGVSGVSGVSFDPPAQSENDREEF
ncbi:hypothetical protein [Deinococcus sp. Leaf326]|uniref:TOTE conflict system archaeo-eukaryotic primase domain-containing protein n=1 Tax=Deinococcus sp. Leaf326 TaxID=1736338 RepID=UPI0006F715F3|nr:hypothetical protein [Deinococcus sp. Leaf326]KQR15600.1 hypothetical protein ASF71_08150 [Deinococcus sp. Leaf326]